MGGKERSGACLLLPRTVLCDGSGAVDAGARIVTPTISVGDA